MHAKFAQMRSFAKQSGKTVPSVQELDQIFAALDEMQCPLCNRQMVLRTNGDTKASTITLQHDRNGSHRLICFSCNAKHGHFDGDSFYDYPIGTKPSSTPNFKYVKRKAARRIHAVPESLGPMRRCSSCRCRMTTDRFAGDSGICDLCIADQKFLNGKRPKPFEPAKPPRLIAA